MMMPRLPLDPRPHPVILVTSTVVGFVPLDSRASSRMTALGAVSRRRATAHSSGFPPGGEELVVRVVFLVVMRLDVIREN